MTQYTVKAKLIEVVQKPYSFAGNEGISYKLRFLVGDEIWELKSSKEQTDILMSSNKKMGDLNYHLIARKEAVSVQVASFEVK